MKIRDVTVRKGGRITTLLAVGVSLPPDAFRIRKGGSSHAFDHIAQAHLSENASIGGSILRHRVDLHSHNMRAAAA